MTRVAVVVPWWPASPPERVHALAIVHDYYETEFPRWGFFVGLDHSELFSRGRAVNRAVHAIERTSAPHWPDVLVCNDADSLVDPGRLIDAVETCRVENALVKAYTRYRRISKEASAGIEGYATALFVDDADIVWEQEGAQSHGVCCFPFDLFLAVGGYDPRGEGWFADDLALDAAWGAHGYAATRIGGDLVHLDHPPDPASLAEHPNFELNGRLQHRYQAAAGDPEATKAIRQEAGWPL